MLRMHYNRFGDPDVLQASELPTPEPQAGEVRVRIAYAGLNPIDVKTRRGLGFAAKAIADHLPFCPGYDVAGIVESVGTSAGQLRVGERVCGMIGFPANGGASATHACVPETQLCLLPPSVDLQQGAALPLTALTALQAIRLLPKAHEVVVSGAGGGVGFLAAQFLLSEGVDVIALASARHHEALRSIGIERIIAPADAQTAPETKKVAAWLDCVGNDAGLAAVHRLAAGSSIVTLPTISAQAMAEAGKARQVTVHGLTVHASSGDLQDILARAGAGHLRARIDAVYPLDRLAEAHRHLESGKAAGKVLIAMPGTN